MFTRIYHWFIDLVLWRERPPIDYKYYNYAHLYLPEEEQKYRLLTKCYHVRSQVRRLVYEYNFNNAEIVEFNKHDLFWLAVNVSIALIYCYLLTTNDDCKGVCYDFGRFSDTFNCIMENVGISLNSMNSYQFGAITFFILLTNTYMNFRGYSLGFEQLYLNWGDNSTKFIFKCFFLLRDELSGEGVENTLVILKFLQENL